MTKEERVELKGRRLVWFSCGVASACALKLMASRYGSELFGVYCNLKKDESPDNIRFRLEIESWTGVGIHVIGSKKYSCVDDVFAKTKYMSGVKGARCTTEMKKVPRLEFQRPDDVHTFGFCSDETGRIKNFEENNPELKLEWILRDQGMTKAKCFGMIMAAGIKRPIRYDQGYKNNNCRGCVKATSPKYWNMTRRDDPEIFEERAKRSRELGVRLTRMKGERIFLDELPADYMVDFQEDLSCGPQCGANK